jgi:hypothetical protein
MEKHAYNPYHAKGSVIFGRIRAFFMGQEPPSLFTRINCNLGLLYLFYIFGWTLVVFLSLNFGKNLPHAGNWDKLFTAIGEKYAITDIHFSFTVYLLTLLVASAVLFAGMVTAWRRKIVGFILVMAAALVSTVSPLLILGLPYVKNECGWWEFAFGGMVFSLFTIDYLVRRKKIKP